VTFRVTGSAVLAGVLVFLGSNLAQAQSSVRALTAEQFLQRFERVDPRRERLAAEVDLARADRSEAAILPNPMLSYDRQEMFPRSGAQPENQLSVSVPLDISGRRGLRIDAAELGVDATRAEVKQRRLLLRVDALASYYEASYLRLRVETLSAGRDSVEQVAVGERQRVARGDGSEYELERIEAALADEDAAVAEARIELRAAEQTLGRYIGEPNALVEPSDSLALPAVQASSAPEHVAETRGDLRGARLRAEQAEKQLAAARRGRIPRVVVMGGLKTVEVGGTTAYGYVAGVAIDLPFFGAARADAERAKALGRGAEADAAFLAREIPARVRSAQDALASRLDLARGYTSRQLPRVAELVRRAEIAYHAGEQPVVDLLDVYRAARDIRLRELALRYNARRSALDLLRELGDLNDGR
jgi:outer membrane protein, heavy metal efflux system